MQGDGLITIELAAGAACLVLAARAFALIQATRAVPEVHAQLLEAHANGDSGSLRLISRRLGFKTPYADLARRVLEADHSRKQEASQERAARLDRARDAAQRRIRRSTHRGQALDLVLLAVVGGVGAFSLGGIQAGLLFRGLCGLAAVLLMATLLVRGGLLRATTSTLEQLVHALADRPSLRPPRDSSRCSSCGSTAQTTRARVEVNGSSHEGEALVCDACGTVVVARSGPDWGLENDDSNHD